MATPCARFVGSQQFRRNWRSSTGASLLACLAALPLDAGAWGADGHHLIAEVAQTQLSASTKAEVDRLLALEPGATLASISTWADEVRTPTTAQWHYVNLPRDSNCKYEPERDCAQGACVVAAIERQIAVLASNASDEQRLKALKYVVHFVGDVYQPLHAGFADDRGGNSFQLQAFGRGTNLHALWDATLIQQWPGGGSALRMAIDDDYKLRPPTDDKAVPRAWAEASCRVASTEGFYPVSHKLDDQYQQRWNATLVQQLAEAGRKLAAVLNQSLGGR